MNQKLKLEDEFNSYNTIELKIIIGYNETFDMFNDPPDQKYKMNKFDISPTKEAFEKIIGLLELMVKKFRVEYNCWKNKNEHDISIELERAPIQHVECNYESFIIYAFGGSVRIKYNTIKTIELFPTQIELYSPNKFRISIW